MSGKIVMRQALNKKSTARSLLYVYQYLMGRGFPTIRSYLDKEAFYKDITAGEISFPVFVKPVTGGASCNTHKVTPD